MTFATACKSLLLGMVSLSALSACSPSGSSSGEGVVNVYTARHYASDDALYDAFTEHTGIDVNVIEAPGDLLIERVRADGDRSQADVVITVDAGRLWRADEAGLFQPAPELEGVLQNVPANLRQPDGDWFGFSKRVRVIAYAKDRVDPSEISNFDDLTDPQWHGRICVRSSNNVYNQSLLAAIVAQEGAEAAEAWAQGVVNNMARPPQGGDTDQIRAVAARECDVAIINHYYLARFMRSENPGDHEIGEQIGVVFADLGDGGAHVNVSGAGLAANAPNRENAIAFLQFLLTDESQRLFAELTNEYPVIPSVTYDNDVLDAFGAYSSDDVNVDELGANAGEAQRIFDRVGWP